jgi:hypothetical protein
MKRILLTTVALIGLSVPASPGVFCPRGQEPLWKEGGGMIGCIPEKPRPTINDVLKMFDTSCSGLDKYPYETKMKLLNGAAHGAIDAQNEPISDSAYEIANEVAKRCSETPDGDWSTLTAEVAIARLRQVIQ